MSWLQFPDEDGAVTMGLARADQVDQDVLGSRTLLKRYDDEVWFRVHARRLAPNNAYTVWMVIWNNPENCTTTVPGTGSLCGEGDLGNAAAGFSVMWSGIGGQAWNGDLGGAINASGHVKEGTAPGQILAGLGLTDAQHAEMHFIVRGHGMNDPANFPDQTSTVAGGCGTYTCGDVQASIHTPTS